MGRTGLDLENHSEPILHCLEEVDAVEADTVASGAAVDEIALAVLGVDHVVTRTGDDNVTTVGVDRVVASEAAV